MDVAALNKKWAALEAALRAKYGTLQSRGYRVVSAVVNDHVMVFTQNAFLAEDDIRLPTLNAFLGRETYSDGLGGMPYQTLVKLFSRSVLEPFLAEIEQKYQADQAALREAEESRKKAGESLDWAISILQRAE